METSNYRICIINGEWSNIAHLLDLCRSIKVSLHSLCCDEHNLQDLNLFITHVESELLNSALDSIPASQSRSKVYVSSHAEISRIYNFVCARRVQYGLGVNTCLVSESTEACDWVVERNIDLD